MPSPRNSVRVVLLIARGWRGTSLPRGNVRKEIQRHRCWAFSAQFTINYGIKKRQSWYKKNVSTPSVLRFLSVIRHKFPHYTYAFSEKAQHLQRWIPLRTFTRGRLVPRQPRAIKRTTPTALHHEGMYIVKYIHWNIDIFCHLFIHMLALIVS